MKMTKILEQIPQQIVTEIIKNDPIAASLKRGVPLAQIMLSEPTFKALFQAMKPWEKRTLKLIVSKFADLPFGLTDLIAEVNLSGISGAELKVGLAGLQRKGIVYAVSKHWGENSYSLPEELLAIWQNIIMAPSLTWELISESDVQSQADEPKLLLNNLFCFLNYLEHQQVILTQKAEIPKRQIPKIAEKLKWKISPINWEINPKYLSLYPFALAFMIDIAERLDLIRWSKTKLVLCRTELNIWLQLSQAEMNKQLLQLFRDSFIPKSAVNQHFLTKICSLPSQNWYLIEDFTFWLQEYDIIIMFPDWMEMCEALGWIELGINHRSQGIFRLSINQENANECITPAGKIYVQPDYEILVPPDVAFAVRWELTYISDHVYTEQVGVYRLTEQSLQRALQNGKSLEGWIDYLTKHSYYGVSESMVHVLKQWARTEILTEKIAIVDDEFDFVNIGNEILSLEDSNPSNTYNFSARIPSRDEVYPAWQEVSPMWWKECRVYHVSTRKEIVQLAIKWKAILKLNHTDREWMLIPKQIIHHEAGWNLVGWVELDLITYSQDQWQGMQLCLPGFDDLIN